MIPANNQGPAPMYPQNNNNGGSNFSYRINTALPVSLSLFSVDVIKFKKTKLNWQTSSEINNNYFEVQYSEDGKTFQSIGKVEGSGNSSRMTQYEFMHENPDEGTSYYRLKQVDFDGIMSYTPVKSISFDVPHTNKTLRIFPNPVTQQLSIQGKNTEETQIQIFNAQGSRMDDLLFHKERASLSVDVSNLPAGLYLLYTDDESLRFIKY